jgi:hypothetical protein
MRPWSLLLALVLAGCLGGGGHGGDGGSGSDGGDGSGDGGGDGMGAGNGTAPPPPGPPAVLDLLVDFDLEGCEGLTVLHDQAASDVQGLLPDGFTPTPDPVTGQEGSAVLALDLLRCDALATPGSNVTDTVYGQVYTFVERPTGAFPSAPEAPSQEYVFRVLGGDDILPLLWATAGYEVRNGTASYDPGPGSGVGFYLQDFSVGDYRAAAQSSSLAGTALPLPITGGFARYTMLADGSMLVWTGTYGFPTALGGTGRFAVPSDDPFYPFRNPATQELVGFSLTYPGGDQQDMLLRRYWPPFA